MSLLIDLLRRPLPLQRCILPSRLVRSATYEGMADAQGLPLPPLGDYYARLVKDIPLTLITGFCTISEQGRAMHPRQGSIATDEHLVAWANIVHQVKRANPKAFLVMQIAHAGRQTRTRVTGHPVVGASSRKCTYFREPVVSLTEQAIESIAKDFGKAALRAQKAGFDGVQLHAAHGYLIHQFISSYTNTRHDRWSHPGLFLEQCVFAVRSLCGPDFPVFLKVSHADDRGLTTTRVIEALRGVEQDIEALEVSYGTMEYAMNIFRGDCPVDVVLKVNPLFCSIPSVLKKLWKRVVYPFKRNAFQPFTPLYNLPGALTLRNALTLPVIPVGGIHTVEGMETCLLHHNFPAVALCRPFVCEPDLAGNLTKGQWQRSACTQCNLCAVYCDSSLSLRCFQGGRSHDTHAF